MNYYQSNDYVIKLTIWFSVLQFENVLARQVILKVSTVYLRTIKVTFDIMETI